MSQYGNRETLPEITGQDSLKVKKKTVSRESRSTLCLSVSCCISVTAACTYIQGLKTDVLQWRAQDNKK